GGGGFRTPLIRPKRDASDSSRFCTALSCLADTEI
ncbi:MAG: hypothetical protein ACI8RE_001825, partial [Ilumatobacter sp.]